MLYGLFRRWSVPAGHASPGATAADAEGVGSFHDGGELRVGRVGGRPAAGDAGGAVACRYRMVLDSVMDYRFVRD
jgi:hypothetical protein